MIEDHALELGGQMDLDGAELREAIEQLGRERRGAVLHRATDAVTLAGDPRDGLERVEVHLHLGDLPVGKRHAAVRRPGLDRDLADAGRRRSPALERPAIDRHERVELLGRRVLAADLADLAAHRNGDALRLVRADERGEIRAQLAIELLLRFVALLRQIHERRGVDVDVVEARVQRFGSEGLDRLDLRFGIRRVLLGVDLEVITLQEERPAPAFAQSGGDHHEGVLGRPLIGVADLGARDLADHRPGIELLARAEERAGGVVGHAPDVDGGHGEGRGRLAPAAGHVKPVDRGGIEARGPGLIEHGGAGGVAQLGCGEDAGPDQSVERVGVAGGERGVGVANLVEGLEFHEKVEVLVGRRATGRRRHRVGVAWGGTSAAPQDNRREYSPQLRAASRLRCILWPWERL